MTAPFIAIATGGRNFVSNAIHCREMSQASAGAVILFHGGADGFDTAAARVANDSHVPVCAVPALWRFEGKKAGPCRNARMLRMALDMALELDIPVRLIVGPGGRGTADMVKRARSADVEVVAVCGAKP